MCGRYVLFGPSKQGEIAFGFEPFDIRDNAHLLFEAHYNIAPTSMIPVVRERDGKRVVEGVRWGLRARGNHIVRGDSVDKPWARSMLIASRCIIPANGFYEWRTEGKVKQPFYVRPKAADQLWGFAAVIGYWEGEGVAMFTTEANETMARIHDRMPVILQHADYCAWLDPGNQDFDALEALLRALPDDQLVAYPVAKAVGSTVNDGPGLIEPLAELGDLDRTD